MARPERFELPTNWFEASYSIQLSYGRADRAVYMKCGSPEILAPARAPSPFVCTKSVPTAPAAVHAARLRCNAILGIIFKSHVKQWDTDIHTAWHSYCCSPV